MPSLIYATFRQAILNRQQLAFDYKHHRRVVCPHVLGLKGGQEQAFCYQFGGSSSQGPPIPNSPDNWRCIELDKVSGLQVLQGPWHSASNYNSVTQECVDTIDVRV